MAVWHPITNLRDYISHNPPGVTFFLCLLTLAISFICLSSYSYTHTLPNPDTAKDWNHLLASLSEFQLCVNANTNSSELVSPVPSPPMKQGQQRDISVNSSKTAAITHLQVIVPLTVTASDSVKDFSLHTTLEASQLHLGGKEIVNVTLDFLPGNRTHTCLTISAPTHCLPMSLLPPQCPAFERKNSPINVEVNNQVATASQTCYSLQATDDPTLTVMLTQEEQGVAVHHLLEVSVCLLGVCVVLCLAASLTRSLTRRHHWNGLDLQNDPLIDS